jgi:hypothetical protein
MQGIPRQLGIARRFRIFVTYMSTLLDSHLARLDFAGLTPPCGGVEAGWNLEAFRANSVLGCGRKAPAT